MSFFKKMFGEGPSSPKSETETFTMWHLRDKVVEKLKEQEPSIKTFVNDANAEVLNVEGPDGSGGQCNLSNFYKNITLMDASIEETVDNIVNSIIAGVGPTKKIEAGDLIPLLRPAAYLGNASPELRKIISRPFCGELFEICMADMPTTMRGLLDEDIEGLNIADPLYVAQENMRQYLSGLYRDDSLGFATLYSVEDHAHLAPSLVLFDEFWAQPDSQYPNGCLFAVPRRDQLFLVDLSDPNAVQNMQHLIHVTFQDDFNLLSPEIFVRKAGEISILNAE